MEKKKKWKKGRENNLTTGLDRNLLPVGENTIRWPSPVDGQIYPPSQQIQLLVDLTGWTTIAGINPAPGTIKPFHGWNIHSDPSPSTFQLEHFSHFDPPPLPSALDRVIRFDNGQKRRNMGRACSPERDCRSNLITRWRETFGETEKNGVAVKSVSERLERGKWGWDN